MIRHALLAVVATIASSLTASAAPCTMGDAFDPPCFRARLTPAIRATLVTYGVDASAADLSKVEALFKERFEVATEGQLHIEIVDRAQIPLRDEPRDLSEVRNSIHGDDSRRALDRLIRIWYYYSTEPAALVEEVQDELKKDGFGPALDDSDIVLVLSAPQFEGLGFATGGYGVTEQPTEAAWGLADGGMTTYNSPEKLVDELLHETGHLLGLDHASARCYGNSVTGPARVQCCQASPGGQDVMSYCRDRNRVQGPYYFRYTSCTKEFLIQTTLPALLQGGQRPFQSKPCE